MLRGNVQNETLQVAGAQTVTNTSLAVNVGQFRSVVVFLNVTAVSGTTPSMTVKIQDTGDGTNWVDTGSAFAPVTAAGIFRLVVPDLGLFLRAVSTITGTTPSFTYSLVVCGND